MSSRNETEPSNSRIVIAMIMILVVAAAVLYTFY